MKLKKLDKKVKILWFIESAIWVALILVGVILPIIFADESVKLILALSLGIPMGLLSIFLLVYPILRYHFYSYYYDEERILIYKGVIFKKSVILPVRQIQDIHIYQGPLMLIMGLSGVSVSTAGSNFNIACINKNDAKIMVDDLETNLNNRLGDNTNEEV